MSSGCVDLTNSVDLLQPYMCPSFVNFVTYLNIFLIWKLVGIQVEAHVVCMAAVGGHIAHLITVLTGRGDIINQVFK